MALTKYKEKRDFKKTPEPTDKASKTKKNLRFVIQRHQARRLHYDLRLEMEGVLKSWAVPKGPSMNPEDKRLAMMTEDHPYKYVDFEGVIPEGNYGAGIMDVYDEGTYHAPGITDKKKSEKELLKGLEEGNLKFELEGKKIKGTFALVKMKGKQDNAWLMVKKDDEFAVEEPYSSEDYLDDLTSVKKGLKKRDKKDSKKVSSKSKSKSKSKGTKEAEIPTQAMPHNIKPMLAKIKEEPFDNEDWLFELKYDGYRAIAEIGKGEVNIYSRNLNSFNSKFKPLVKKLQKLGHEAVLDGEVVILNKEGKPEFQLLQNFQKTRKGDLHFYVFDLLYLNGYELFDLPLIERKRFLKEIISELDDPAIIYSDHIFSEGVSFFKEAQESEMEGIIAKKADSTYHTNSRSNNWLKVKTSMRQEAVIAGFTEPRGSRKTFGALVLGVHDKGKLQYIGHTGGGFNSASLKAIMEKMTPLIRKTSPFPNKIQTNTPVTWIKPELVCEISFSEWTEDGSMRHPIFQGLREDKGAKEVVREAPDEIPDGKKLENKKEKATKKSDGTSKTKKAKEAIPEPSTKSEKPKKTEKTEKKSSSKNALPKIAKGDRDKEVELDGRTLQLTSLDKVYWPEEGYTKGDVIQHYLEVSEFILPYLKDRPENMLRHPNGIGEKGFFHKDVSELNMEWLETVEVYSESNDKDIQYLICNNQATLTYMNQLGCIEINPWNSRVQSLENPDWIVIDLDPADNTFDEVIETALAVKEVLDKAGAESFIKTSGSSGMHIFIPMGAKYDYEQAKNFAHVIAQLTHEKLPKLTSLKRSPKERKKQIYLDYLQNRKGQTLSVVYSVRPKPGATVSTPLKWEEVKKGLHPSQFTIKNTTKRLKKHGDLFKGILGKGVDMEKCLENLSS